jgi:hypothetical protein
MHASRAFIAMLVLVASYFAPALSTPLECVHFLFNSCDAPELFAVLVVPVNATRRTESGVISPAFNPK